MRRCCVGLTISFCVLTTGGLCRNRMKFLAFRNLDHTRSLSMTDTNGGLCERISHVRISLCHDRERFACGRSAARARLRSSQTDCGHCHFLLLFARRPSPLRRRGGCDRYYQPRVCSVPAATDRAVWKTIYAIQVPDHVSRCRRTPCGSRAS